MGNESKITTCAYRFPMGTKLTISGGLTHKKTGTELKVSKELDLSGLNPLWIIDQTLNTAAFTKLSNKTQSMAVREAEKFVKEPMTMQELLGRGMVVQKTPESIMAEKLGCSVELAEEFLKASTEGNSLRLLEVMDLIKAEKSESTVSEEQAAIKKAEILANF